MAHAGQGLSGFVRGLSNTSWYLLQANQFSEAEPYARAAAVPQDPLRLYPLVHLVRIQIAANQPQLAAETLAQAQVLRGRDDADETGVDVLVAQGQYAKAAKLLPQIHGSDALQQRMKLRAQLLLAAAQRAPCSRRYAKMQRRRR